MVRSPRSTGAVQEQLGAKAYVAYQPKGSIGIIGTWNAPLFTLLSPSPAHSEPATVPF